MTGNIHLLEKMQIQPAIMPVNLAAGGPNTGDWVGMQHYERCGVVFCAGAGTAGQDPTITVQQATNASGANAKALNFTRVDYKEATALTSVGQFTTLFPAAGNTFTQSGSAALQKMWVVDFKAEDLDINNNFDYVQVSVAHPGTNSQIGVALYLLHCPRDLSKQLPSAIV